MALGDLLLDVRNLSKTIKKRQIIKNINLQVFEGQLFGFIGPNGAGKTTTLRLICGLLIPTKGSGTFSNYDIRKKTRLIRSMVGYKPQIFSLYSDLTVYENLKFAARINCVKDFAKRVNEVVKIFKLEKYLNYLASELSGGWKQRLSIASVMLHNPKLLLLDEPTLDMDPTARQEFWFLANKLLKDGTTILITSNRIDEIEHCDRISYISNGEIIITGTVESIAEKTKLYTCVAEFPRAYRLIGKLRHEYDIEQITFSPSTIRITSDNKAKLGKLSSEISRATGIKWKHSTSNLEDIFLWLAKNSKNYE